MIAIPNQTILVTVVMSWWLAQVPEGYVSLINETIPEAIIVFGMLIRYVSTDWLVLVYIWASEEVATILSIESFC